MLPHIVETHYSLWMDGAARVSQQHYARSKDADNPTAQNLQQNSKQNVVVIWQTSCKVQAELKTLLVGNPIQFTQGHQLQLRMNRFIELVKMVKNNQAG